MSWNGYIRWLQDQEKKAEKLLEKGDIEGARVITESALFSLLRVEDKAPPKQKKALEHLGKKFREIQSNIEDSEEGVISELFTDLNYSPSPKEKIDNLIKEGNYKEALPLLLEHYRRGARDFSLIKEIIFCYHQIGDYEGLCEFLQDVLMEEFRFKKEELSLLYHELGTAFLHLHKITQARETFWKLKRLSPSFPGLNEKLKELERKKTRTKSRYELLLREKIITPEQLEEAKKKAKEEKRDLDEVLVTEFNVSKEELGRSLSTFYDVPFVAFNPNVEPPFALFEKRKLDPEFLKQYEWVPFKEEGKQIQVLMTNPFDLGRLDEIKFILGTNNIEPLVSTKKDIEDYIDLFFRELTAGEELLKFDEEVEAEDSEEDVLSELEESLSEQDSEIVRLVNAILVEAWRRGASDIHIEPNTISKYCLVRMRIDGTCHEFKKIRLNYARPLVSRIKIMARLDIAERRLPQDGKLKIRLPNMNKIVEYRVATLPTIDNQEDVVLRVLASGKPIPLDKLGLLPENLEKFKSQITQPYGMVLVVGPTGSGKTTTLHSALGYINKPERKIWTAEDPVEITQEGLRQVQVNPKIGLTFASALRAFLRADPDVIMIGEMRDKETAHIGIEASLTGHLVFSTLHTNSAPETITRLLDMDLDPFNFSDSLLCILAQRLIKTLCPHCKEEYKPSKKELQELREEFGPDKWREVVDEKSIVLCRAKGCSQCMGGYRGRMGVHELLLSSPQIKALIKRRAPTEDIREVAYKEGMLSLKQDGILKVLQGLTDIYQVRAVAGK